MNFDFDVDAEYISCEKTEMLTDYAFEAVPSLLSFVFSKHKSWLLIIFGENFDVHCAILRNIRLCLNCTNK